MAETFYLAREVVEHIHSESSSTVQQYLDSFGFFAVEYLGAGSGSF